MDPLSVTTRHQKQATCATWLVLKARVHVLNRERLPKRGLLAMRFPWVVGRLVCLLLENSKGPPLLANSGSRSWLLCKHFVAWRFLQLEWDQCCELRWRVHVGLCQTFLRHPVCPNASEFSWTWKWWTQTELRFMDTCELASWACCMAVWTWWMKMGAFSRRKKKKKILYTHVHFAKIARS